ncbi:hypothetical protein HPB47_003587 [Ixodes persulcatus]|uniref:Uncharacterized protein n=1 Tax=Ixodes persulcatus TaxID=34615 RepID=A0AC60PJN2_IXOPE|nr:hypothetical protein HPB47_003587 [Ixodes persulcatus]
MANAMAADHASRRMQWKYPEFYYHNAVIGDSQIKYLHQHFDPHRKDAPASISQTGTLISDIGGLMDFLPRTVTTLVLHVGVNDLTTIGVAAAFNRYRDLLHKISRERREITSVFATLALPRYLNRRHGERGLDAVRRDNQEAWRFNERLRGHCRRVAGMFYIDHAFHHLPPTRVLAGDGLHPSFCGVALLAGNLHRVLPRGGRRDHPGWLDHVAPPISTCHAQTQTDQAYQHLRPTVLWTACGSGRLCRNGRTYGRRRGVRPVKGGQYIRPDASPSVAPILSAWRASSTPSASSEEFRSADSPRASAASPSSSAPPPARSASPSVTRPSAPGEQGSAPSGAAGDVRSTCSPSTSVASPSSALHGDGAPTTSGELSPVQPSRFPGGGNDSEERKTPRPSEVLSPGRLPFAEDAEARRSRRTRGQSPELGLLPDKPRPKKTTMANQSQTPAASAVIYLPEELKKLLPTAARPASLSIAEVVREVQRAIQPEAPVVVAATEEPALTYAAVARRPPPPPRTYVEPPRRESPVPQHDRRHDDPVQYARPEPRAPRKTDCSFYTECLHGGTAAEGATQEAHQIGTRATPFSNQLGMTDHGGDDTGHGQTTDLGNAVWAQRAPRSRQSGEPA